jgi:CheY-like chemotaxis protein
MLDLRMPKVDGYQVLELLRTRKKDNLMKVVVLSAYIDAEAQERLANSVADEVWEKRKEISELLDSLQNMLESPKQARVSATILRSRNVRNHATHAV